MIACMTCPILRIHDLSYATRFEGISSPESSIRECFDCDPLVGDTQSSLSLSVETNGLDLSCASNASSWFSNERERRQGQRRGGEDDIRNFSDGVST